MMWIVACSGPGAMKAIEHHERVGWLVFLIAVGIAVATFTLLLVMRRSTRWMFATVASALLHPGLWMSARSGDCGGTLYILSFVGLALTGVLALVTLIRGLRQRRVTVV